MSYYQLDALEVAAGYLHGRVAPPQRELQEASVGPREVLERVVLAGLLRPPCVVAFSGGRDSSALLAIAADVARREGLPLPLPVTLSYAHEDADESVWQRQVLEHLRLEAVQVDATGLRDLLGPEGRAALHERGVTWPPLLHDKEPLLRLAEGGTLITGDGGDEVLGPQRLTPLAVALRRRRRAGLRMWAAGLAAVAPASLRSKRWHRETPELPWLTAKGDQQRRAAALADHLSQPLRWGESVRSWRWTRSTVIGLDGIERQARAHDVRTALPFLTPSFIDRVAGAWGPWGTNGRGDALRRLVGDLLPQSAVYRTSKAAFNAVTFGRLTRAALADWDGEGVPLELVDVAALRREWQSPAPSAATVPLAQAAYLGMAQ